LHEAPSHQVISGVGEVFKMRMHNDEMGDYEISNLVVELEPDHRIAWEQILIAASLAEDQADTGERNSHRWPHEISTVDPISTLVTETYDCSGSPEWLSRAAREGAHWRDSMTTSLERLEARNAADGAVRRLAPPPSHLASPHSAARRGQDATRTTARSAVIVLAIRSSGTVRAGRPGRQRAHALANGLLLDDAPIDSIVGVDADYRFSEGLRLLRVVAIAGHAQLAGEVDISCPKLLGPGGLVMNDVHCIARAILAGR